MLRNNRKKLIMWLILFMIVVNSPDRKSVGAVLLEDDFSGNVIDTSIWTVTTADSGYVFQKNGLIIGGVGYMDTLRLTPIIFLFREMKK